MIADLIRRERKNIEDFSKVTYRIPESCWDMRKPALDRRLE